MNVELYIEEFVTLWNNSHTRFPELGEVISHEEKIKREEALEQFMKHAKREVSVTGTDVFGGSNLPLNTKQRVVGIFKHIFDFQDDEFSVFSGRGFTSVTKEFMSMARNFDPSVSMDDVFQACRNLWIINSLQILMDEPVRVGSAAFAYSMLYPYTDNYLDDVSVSKSEKISFSNRFSARLHGYNVLAVNNYEQKIFDLVSMIEIEWPRQNYPKVYESLVAIHDAQTQSIQLVSKDSALTDNDLLSVCIAKGGTSVVADGYLIRGDMTVEQEWFCFGFGTLLQFIDDIQDVNEDCSGQLETIFTRGALSGKLEELTNRTLSFTNSVLEKINYCYRSSAMPSVRGLMEKSVVSMLSEAVALNVQFFSPVYSSAFEQHSPFRYSFIRKRRNNSDPSRISLMKTIEGYIFGKEKAVVGIS